jgi:hypothetical protein
MHALLHTLIVVFLYVFYILLIPVVMLFATPFILLWPGKKCANGTRKKKSIKKRYARIWEIMKSIGVGLPTS